MKTLRKAAERGRTGAGWLDSRHSFSFADYYDEDRMAFGPLRVINEDFIAGGGGFPTHGHKNMEIITYVLEGALSHKDSIGNGSSIRPGDVQLMSAGKGILHSEFNASDKDRVHLLQIWIMPSRDGTPPAYQQRNFDPAEMENKLKLVVSESGEDGSLVILQAAKLFVAKIDAGREVSFDMRPERKYWIQAARGNVAAGTAALAPGDALGLENETGTMRVSAHDRAEIILFDLPA